MTTYVLDTSTLIYDPQVFFKYEGDDFVVPMTVLKELDSIKSNNDFRGSQAREVFRILDKLRSESSNDSSYNEGIDNQHGGKIFVELNHVSYEDSSLFPPEFKVDDNDDIIIVVTRNLALQKYYDKLLEKDDLSINERVHKKRLEKSFIGKVVESLKDNTKENKEHTKDSAHEELEKAVREIDIYLMTQDVSMSIRADILNIKSLRHTLNDERFVLHKGVQYVELAPNYYQYGGEQPVFLLDELYDHGVIDVREYVNENIPQDIPINTGVVLKDGSQSALAVSDGEGKLYLIKPDDVQTGLFTPKGAEQKIATHLMSGHVRNNYLSHYKNSTGNEFICSLSGKAGSGKTSIAILNALHGVRAGIYDRIIIFRPTVNMSKNSNLGYLPGDLEEKMSPWKDAIYDVFRSMGITRGENDKINNNLNNDIDIDEIVKIEPVNYLRGRTFNNTFVIVDEAQNLEPHELYTIVTRLGSGSSIVIVWDENQIDNTFITNKRAEAPLSVLEKVMPDARAFHIELPNNERGGISAMFT